MHAEHLEKLEHELRELLEKKDHLEAELTPINQRIERIKIEIRYLGAAPDHVSLGHANPLATHPHG